ncbi:MAG: type I methionyl aminopeptidase [Candidatus Daviesbacteria bacterium]|nr:type I methionyl aminopeptidase [Candidatus Daviesbacteria bacterium]
MKSKNQYELSLMRKSGDILSKVLKLALESIKIGATGIEVDGIATEEIYKLGGDLSYKTVPGYKFATCITVNDEVVHGIPTSRKFENGNLVSIDLAVMYKGWHTDAAWSILIGKDTEKEKFLKVGQEALWDGIAQATPGNRVGDISNAIQTKVEGVGYQVVRSLVGHGVGRSLHEEPEIPGFGQKNTGMILTTGMSLAIEIIYAKGSSDVILDKDGWTFKTADGSWGGLFEMTVIVDKKPEVLTCPQCFA